MQVMEAVETGKEKSWIRIIGGTEDIVKDRFQRYIVNAERFRTPVTHEKGPHHACSLHR
jgi:hypothetical protein